MNIASLSAPHLSCEICGCISHLTVNCQVASAFSQDTSDQVNYVNNFKPGRTNDPFANTYNPG